MTELDGEIVDIYQFLSLLRAFVGKTSKKPAADRDAFRLWLMVYGRSYVTGHTAQELAQEMGRLLTCKIAAASVVALHLAFKVAQHEGVQPVEVLDRIERQIMSIKENDGNGKS